MTIWMDVDAALSEVPVNVMPLLDDTDFKSIESAVAYNASGMALKWNFIDTAGNYTQTAVTPTTAGTYDWAHQGGGMYSIEIPASGGASINNDTEGFGWFSGVATGVLPWRGPVIGFRAAALNNALIDGGAVLDANVTKFGGTNGTFSGGRPEVNASHLGGTSQTGRDIGASVLLSSGTGTGQVSLSSGTVTVGTNNDKTGYRLSATGVDDVWDEAQSGHTTAGTFGKYLDAAVSGVSTGGVSAADIADAVWDEARSGHVSAGSFGEGVKVESLNTQAKADVNAEADTAASDYGALKPTTAGRTLDVTTTGEAGIDWANIGGKTTTNDFSGTTISTSQAVASVSGAVASVTGNVGGNVTGSVGALATQAKADVNAEVVDALTVDVIADSVASDGSRPTIAQALLMLTRFLMEASASGTTLTVKKENGSTTSMTFTLNDATTPTSITRAS